MGFVAASISAGCADNDSAAPEGAPGGGTGKAGSMARFAIDGDNLYAIAGAEIKQFDISTPNRPGLWSTVEVAFDIETLFPYEDYLFIGSETGVHIYEFSSLGQLEEVSSLLHVQSCDPVVVEGDRAYVTLRGDSRCSLDGVNQFQIIDISDIRRPVLLESYDMAGPRGLGVDDGQVFICDGDTGLKVLDVTEPSDLRRIDHLPEQICYDVIPDMGELIVSSFDGLYQYNYDEPMLVELSRLQIAEEDLL